MSMKQVRTNAIRKINKGVPVRDAIDSALKIVARGSVFRERNRILEVLKSLKWDGDRQTECTPDLSLLISVFEVVNT